MADDAVCYEPLSAAKFPVKQGICREFSRFSSSAAPLTVEKPQFA
jgi:hypothetical protein